MRRDVEGSPTKSQTNSPAQPDDAQPDFDSDDLDNDDGPAFKVVDQNADVEMPNTSDKSPKQKGHMNAASSKKSMGAQSNSRAAGKHSMGGNPNVNHRAANPFAVGSGGAANLDKIVDQGVSLSSAISVHTVKP